MQTYELPLSRNYVRHWGMAEAVRELIQNALDSESPFEYEIDGDRLSITSRFAKLEPNSLLLGSTTKAERTDKIGSFGEGYKIALLVLTRLEYPVCVHNGALEWTPEFRRSRQFDDDLLCIVQRKASRKREGVTFDVSGLGADEISQIKESCLYMQDNVGAIKNVPQGRILLERPGKLYVGGLYICDTKLHFGYDVKPEFIALERDRQTVDAFDLQLLTKDMWFETEEYERIAELIEQDVPDLEMAEFSSPALVKEACYRRFQKQHPSGVVAKNQEELDRLVKQGLTNTVVVNSRFHANVSASNSYRESRTQLVAVPSPADLLAKYFERNRSLMRRKAIVEFKDILKQAASWRHK